MKRWLEMDRCVDGGMEMFAHGWMDGQAWRCLEMDRVLVDGRMVGDVDGWMEMFGDRWMATFITDGWLNGRRCLQMCLGWLIAWGWTALGTRVPHPDGVAGDPHLVGQRDDF